MSTVADDDDDGRPASGAGDRGFPDAPGVRDILPVASMMILERSRSENIAFKRFLNVEILWTFL